MKRHEIQGYTFGRLTVVEPVRTQRVRPSGRVENDIKWLCTCTCGMTTLAAASDLITGRKQSCGCLHREGNKTTHGGSARIKHGGKPERLYTIWLAMKNRCYSENYQHKKNYSMKGIKVCDEWKNDYAVFREWSFAHGYYEQDKKTPHKEILSIDRIDPDKDYCPENCQWISCDENLRKRFADRKGVRPNDADEDRRAKREAEVISES